MSEQRKFVVLVCDDNPATRYATARVLRLAGYETREAGLGSEALELADGVHAIVLDVNLPDFDGFEVCRRLRANELTARIPVIHLSATFVTDVHKIRALDAGADGYLTHPVEPPVLVATINAFVRARRAEEQLHASEAKFRAIFNEAANGICLLSHSLIFLEANPALCRILGRPLEETVGKHLSVFMPAENEQYLLKISDRLDSTGSWAGTLPLLRGDGHPVDTDWSISAHSIPDSSLASITDATERVRTELARNRLLASERAARSAAERANQAKDDFLATLSHELRTPLSAIIGWSQVLKTGQLSPADVAEGLDAIERSGRIQAQLIEDLLDVSRIASGKLRLEFETFDAVAMVSQALEGVVPAAQAKRVNVHVHLPDEPKPIVGDPSRLQQVVWNLVNNAVKFTPSGGNVDIRLHALREATEITVTDDGKGIRPEFLPYLFDRFRQEDASTKRSYGGLGLGLAIVKHVVELHGGTVRATSAGEGHGSLFSVWLPALATPLQTAPKDDDVGLEQLPNYLTAANLEAMRVLLVDDDDDTRTLVARILKDCRANVVEANSVQTALDMLIDVKPHIVVSDIGMPHEDGYDMIRTIRSSQGTLGQIPAIALTAFASSEDRMRALEAGYDLHLGKPIDPSKLVSSIAALVNRHSKTSREQTSRPETNG